MFKLDNSLYGDLYKPQYEYIKNNRIDFIGRQESFNQDFNKILKQFNIETNIKNNNIRKSNNYKREYKYIHKYNKTTIDLINQKYDIDFRKFKYNKL
jgi:hypothetical protein